MIDRMKEFKYIITDQVGLHARPAGLLVKTASEWNSRITVFGNGKSVDAKKLIALMGLGIKQGMEVTCQIEGEDEESAYQAVLNFFKENL